MPSKPSRVEISMFGGEPQRARQSLTIAAPAADAVATAPPTPKAAVVEPHWGWTASLWLQNRG